jgi:pentatricopeptide repeat protein
VRTIASTSSSTSIGSCEPYRESGWRILMQALAAEGNPAEALQTYEQLRVLLREELGVAPGAPTQELYRTLLG